MTQIYHSRRFSGLAKLQVVAVLALAAAGVDSAFAQGGSLFDEAFRGATPRRPQDPNANVTAMMKQPAAVAEPDYPLSDRQGPIMIKLCSFEGEDKLQYANALARELRQDYRIEAYIFRYQAGFASPEMVEEYKEWFKKQYGVEPRIQKLQTEPPVNWVVLAGNYPNFEDKSAHDALKKIRKIDPKSLPAAVREELYSPFADTNVSQAERRRLRLTGRAPNPLATSHLVQNPMIPVQRKMELAGTQNPKVLAMLASLNSPTEEPYSIYLLKKPWTIRVASFTGAQQVQKAVDGDMGNAGDYVGSPLLQKAAESAVLTCKVLRDMGYDAYVFHGQYGSMVCVGGYESARDPNLVHDMKALSQVALGPQKYPLKPQAIVTPRDPRGA